MNNREVLIDRRAVSGISQLSNERVIELINSGLVYFKLNKRAANDYSVSMNVRMLGGRPTANKDKDSQKDSANSGNNSQPGSASGSYNDNLTRCTEVAGYSGTGAAIGGTLGDTPGAIVGGAIGSAIGTAACSSGGGDSGGDGGCSVM